MRVIFDDEALDDLQRIFDLASISQPMQKGADALEVGGREGKYAGSQV
jgi:hypothetical protein